MQQVGTCVIFKRHGCYPAAECTKCSWRWEAIHEDDLARFVAEHSRLHERGWGETQTVGTVKVTVDGIPVDQWPASGVPFDYEAEAKAADALAESLLNVDAPQVLVEQARKQATWLRGQTALSKQAITADADVKGKQ